MRSLIDSQQSESGKAPERRLTASDVYNSIRRSNSSLKRRSKKLLEDSIDRVLLVLREDEAESDSVEGDYTGLEEAETPLAKVCDFSVRGRSRQRGSGI